jgi:hypothetical protein
MRAEELQARHTWIDHVADAAGMPKEDGRRTDVVAYVARLRKTVNAGILYSTREALKKEQRPGESLARTVERIVEERNSAVARLAEVRRTVGPA